MNPAPYLIALAARGKAGARRILMVAAFAVAAVAAAVVGLAFATFALFEAWRLQYGAVASGLGIAALYFLLAVILLVCVRFVGRPPPAIATPAAVASPVVDAETAAFNAGVEMSKQVTPVQLVLLAALSGFIAGRRF